VTGPRNLRAEHEAAPYTLQNAVRPDARTVVIRSSIGLDHQGAEGIELGARVARCLRDQNPWMPEGVIVPGFLLLIATRAAS
jgi:hypothetical protein